MADPKNPVSFPPTPLALMGGAAPTDASKPVAATGVGKSYLFDRLGFVKGYANLVARTWVDSDFLTKLIAKPVEMLAQSGIPTTPGAIVIVIQLKITGMGKMEDQISDWIKGMETGEYRLYLPMPPEGIDTSTGGRSGSGDTNCCCTPCCCCT